MCPEFEAEFEKNSPSFNDVLECQYEYKGIMIFGKACFNITGVKGAAIRLAHKDERLYCEWPYTIKKGDYIFQCGGYAPFSHHYMIIYIVADKDAVATIKFSSDEYVLMNSAEYEFQKSVSAMQTPYIRNNIGNASILSKFTTMKSRLFDFDYDFNKYITTFTEDGFHTTRAFASEDDEGAKPG